MEDSDSDLQHSNRSTRQSSRVKPKRTPRVKNEQLDAMLTYLEAQPILASKFPCMREQREKVEEKWQELADMLNSLPNGSVKSSEQWIRVWRDIKSKSCIKAAKIQREKCPAWTKRSYCADLTDIEKRIVALVRSDYVADNDANSPNRISKYDDLQIEFEYLEEPQNKEDETLNSNESLPSESLAHHDHVYSVSPPTKRHISEAEVINGPQQIIAVASSAVTSTAQAPETKTQDTQTDDSIEPAQNQKSTHRNARRSKDEQNSVRSHFLAVAKSNAESMKMLAAATNLQAQAAKMQAEAAISQAASSKIQAQALLRFPDATNKIGDALLLLAKKQ